MTDDAERRSIEAMRQREQIRDSGAVSYVGPSVDELMAGPGDDPIAEWQIVSGWLCEIDEHGEPEPMVELSKLPGYARWLDSITPPAWQYTPDGHDDTYEYTRSYTCDGDLVATFRRRPGRLHVAEPWERIDALPPVETRRLHDPVPGEEPRP